MRGVLRVRSAVCAVRLVRVMCSVRARVCLGECPLLSALTLYRVTPTEGGAHQNHIKLHQTHHIKGTSKAHQTRLGHHVEGTSKAHQRHIKPQQTHHIRRTTSKAARRTTSKADRRFHHVHIKGTSNADIKARATLMSIHGGAVTSK